MQDVQTVTPTGLSVLHALGTFRFLTAAQMMRLGVSKSKRHLYTVLWEITAGRRPAAGMLDFGVLPTVGRLSRVYFLTDLGAELLTDDGRDPGNIHYPRRVRLFRNDYFHRINCVDFHIGLAQWARRSGARVLRYDTYFDYGGGTGKRGPPTPKTRVRLKQGTITPDGVVLLSGEDRKTRLCAVEIHNTTGGTARLERQITAYTRALAESAVEKAYNYDHAVRVLFIMENPRDITAMQTRLKKRRDLGPWLDRLFFKPLAEMRGDFVPGWVQMGAEARTARLY